MVRPPSNSDPALYLCQFQESPLRVTPTWPMRSTSRCGLTAEQRPCFAKVAARRPSSTIPDELSSSTSRTLACPCPPRAQVGWTTRVYCRRDADTRSLMLHWQYRRVRSEEHTSELQSLAYLVCRLLLEKNKK